MKIRWSPTAVSDLETIRDYIAKDSPSAARKIANRIKESVNRSSISPYPADRGVYLGLANWSSLKLPTLPHTRFKATTFRLLPCCTANSGGRSPFSAVAARLDGFFQPVIGILQSN
jgi:hypothetical protein